MDINRQEPDNKTPKRWEAGIRGAWFEMADGSRVPVVFDTDLTTLRCKCVLQEVGIAYHDPYPEEAE